MNAEVCFFDGHMRRFLDPNAETLSQMLARDPVERAIDEDYLPLAEQAVRGGHFVPKGDGGQAVGHIDRQRTAGQHVAQGVGQHQTLTAFDRLARAEAHRRAGGGGRVFHALRVEDHGRGPGFFSAASRLLTFRYVLTPLPRAIVFPLGKILVHRAPGR